MKGLKPSHYRALSHLLNVVHPQVIELKLEQTEESERQLSESSFIFVTVFSWIYIFFLENLCTHIALQGSLHFDIDINVAGVVGGFCIWSSFICLHPTYIPYPKPTIRTSFIATVDREFPPNSSLWRITRPFTLLQNSRWYYADYIYYTQYQ